MKEKEIFAIRGLRLEYPGIRIEGELAVVAGECIILRGPSGCGKSTILRAIAGFADVPVAGSLPRGELPPERRNFGWMTQTPVFLPGRTVVQNLAFPLQLRGRSAAEATRLAREWLERLGLSAQADAMPARLSGGEKQRLSFGRALIFQPDLLLLDEPFSALDGQNERRMLGILNGIARPPALLLSLHDGLGAELGNYRVSEVHCQISEEGRTRAFLR